MNNWKEIYREFSEASTLSGAADVNHFEDWLEENYKVPKRLLKLNKDSKFYKENVLKLEKTVEKKEDDLFQANKDLSRFRSWGRLKDKFTPNK